MTDKSWSKKLPEVKKTTSVSSQLWDCIKSCGITLKTDFGNVTWAYLSCFSKLLYFSLLLP